MMKNYVAIAGNIGVGKTTVTRLVAERLGWKAFYEPVIDNPYLDKFYQDMERWSFHLQIFFLSKRFEAQKEISLSRQSCIQDRTIYEDSEIFARTLHLQGAMTPLDYENYRSLFSVMTSYLQNPDLIVYLQADIDDLVGRINERGRESEKTISRTYLAELNRAYDGWSERASKICPVKIINTSRRLNGEKEAVADVVIEEIKSRFGVLF